jgi:hypothetical protein
VLLRAAPGQDLYGVFTTVAEGFVDVGPEAELRPRTELTDEHWMRAQATGSSRPDGDGAFDDDGLIVQDAGDQRQRWLPRAQLADYMQALLENDSARRLRLTESLERPGPAILARFRIGSMVLVQPGPGEPEVLGPVVDGEDPDQVMVRLSRDECRWFPAGRLAPQGSRDLHRRAEALMSKADSQQAGGAIEPAGQLRREAARLELAAMEAVPQSRPRTRSLLAISAVALLLRAGDVELATVEARRLYRDGHVDQATGAELERILAHPNIEEARRAERGRWAAGGTDSPPAPMPATRATSGPRP